MPKENLPNESLTNNNLTAEADYMNVLYKTKPRSSSGQASYTSTTSGVTYTTTGSIYDSQGQEGLLLILQDALKNYNFVADDYNGLVDNVSELNTVATNHINNTSIHVTQSDKDKWNSLQAQLDRNSYDDYQLWLELYYKGVISHVEADNAKAIMFDGFADRNNVDTTNSTATVDIVNEKVTLENTDISNLVGGSNYSLGVVYSVAQTFKVKKTVKLRSISLKVLNATTTCTYRATLMTTDTYGAPYKTTILGSASMLSSVSSALLVFDFSSLNITLTGGVTYAIAITVPDETATNDGYVQYTETGTYTDGQVYTTSDGGVSWTAQTGRDLNFKVEFDYLSPATLLTDPKTLPFIPTSMKLYQSIKKPTGTTITTTLSTDGGVHYETPTLVTSRDDPKFVGYTEEEYDLTIVNIGQQIKLKSVLTGSNRDAVEIKRYGLIIS